MVVSLEVAEHLKTERADSFVEDLTKISDVVLFSGAAKGQTGEGHINEQYLSYWINKFRKNGYRAFDIVRPLIQGEKQIPWWYKQNIMVYVNQKNEELIHKFENIRQLPPLENFVLIDMYEKYDIRNFRENMKTSIKYKFLCIIEKLIGLEI